MDPVPNQSIEKGYLHCKSLPCLVSFDFVKDVLVIWHFSSKAHPFPQPSSYCQLRSLSAFPSCLSNLFSILKATAFYSIVNKTENLSTFTNKGVTEIDSSVYVSQVSFRENTTYNLNIFNLSQEADKEWKKFFHPRRDSLEYLLENVVWKGRSD